MKKKNSYNREYLQSAQEILAAMIDVAVYYLDYKPADFYDSFLKSDYSHKFEKGDPFTLWGKSGTEIAFDIAQKDIGEYKNKLTESGLKLHRSPEYWAGWSLAYYQWFSNKTFSEINKTTDINKIINLYNPYHEMDIRQFCDKMDSLLQKKIENHNRSD